MIQILYVGIGGGIGAILRYEISKHSANLINCGIPIGTLLVNIIGGLIIGIIMQLSISTNSISNNMRLFLTTGIMGGLTTFSTFSYETVSYIQQGEVINGITNILLNVILSLTAAALGIWLVKMLLVNHGA